MIVSLHEKIEQLNCDCIFIQNTSIMRLESISKDIIAELGIPELNIGQGLSEVLIKEVIRDYSPQSEKWVKSRISEVPSPMICCTNIDLLFEPLLKLDPLVLFRQISRNKRLIVIWPGSFDNEILTYATPEHKHFRSWSKPDVDIISL